MRVYRCYFLNERDRIEAYETIEAHAVQSRPGTRAAAAAPQAQDDRNLGWAEPAISGQEKTA